ncbi:hypothetical protein D3C81_1290390 [compost metagenome]
MLVVVFAQPCAVEPILDTGQGAPVWPVDGVGAGRVPGHVDQLKPCAVLGWQPAGRGKGGEVLWQQLAVVQGRVRLVLGTQGQVHRVVAQQVDQAVAGFHPHMQVGVATVEPA